MGAIAGSVGNRNGARFPPGLLYLAASTAIVITSVQLSQIVTTATGYYPGGFEFGWTKFLFQLAIGDASAGSVQVNGTMDHDTALGISGAAVWDPLPAPSDAAGFAWNNPLGVASGQRLLFVNSGPWSAFQIVPSADFNGTTSYLLFGAAS
jgi:hypothetical protein